MTPETARLRNRRNNAYRAWKHSGTQLAWFHFLELREEYLQHCSTAYQEHLEYQADRLRSSPRSFWRMVRDRRQTNGIPRRMRYSGMKLSSLLESAGLFADYFQSNYAQQSSQHHSPHGPFEELISMASVSLDEVNSALKLLDLHKAVGPDGIPNSFLRSLADELTRPLWLIFSASLESEIFPTQWKSSYVTPIFKSGGRSQFSNYRGIAILSAMAKVFEHIVCSKLDDAIGHKICLLPLSSSHWWSTS